MPFQITEVVNVGDVPNTFTPVPVLSVSAEAKFALEGVARKVATPVPSPLTPLEIGNPVQFVSVPLAGVPSAGVTNVGEVARTTDPVPVTAVMAVPLILKTFPVPAVSYVLFVSVSVVALPTSVSVAAGRVRVPDAVADAAIAVDPLVAPFRLAEVPIQRALAMPTPPDTITEPVETDVVSVTSVEEMPLANGMRAVVAVCPSLQIAVDSPVARSAVSALKTVDEMMVPETTG
mgnify:CR=1 FL=1